MLEHIRRSNVEVIADILRIRGSKTAIMYGANLSYAQTQKYLELLTSRGLLKPQDDGSGRRRVYKTTEKGTKLLGLIENLEVFMDGLFTESGREAQLVGSRAY